MRSLPQLHDWFMGLLTINQWLFVWIVVALIVIGLGIYIAAAEDDVDIFGVSIYLAILGPPILWFVIFGVLAFVSFMIMLLNT